MTSTFNMEGNQHDNSDKLPRIGNQENLKIENVKVKINLNQIMKKE